MNPLDFLNVLTPIVNKVLDYIPDPEAKAKAQKEMMDTMLAAAATQNAQQASIDTDEAKSGSMFVAGWRPAVGWVCVSALSWQYMLRPLAGFALFLATKQHVDLPGIDDNLWQLLLGMLGMGGLRTLEKFGGVQTLVTGAVASKK